MIIQHCSMVRASIRVVCVLHALTYTKFEFDSVNIVFNLVEESYCTSSFSLFMFTHRDNYGP